MKPRVLIVDDEKNIRRTLELTLRGAGYQPIPLDSGTALLDSLATEPADLILLDIRLGQEDGLTLLRDVVQSHPGLPVIMISGHATVALAVEATQAGAIDFLEKPLDRERVLLSLRNALQIGQLRKRVGHLESREERRTTLLGDSPAMQGIRKTIAKVAATQATVLITGESGTGKELVAQAIHRGSSRRNGPFIKVNCAAIPDDLIEAELFGSVRGAFTGADRTRDGRFLLADGGTLLLDEIGDMSLRVQAKVLRVLQEGELERVGDSRTLQTDVRVIAATHRDLQRAAQERSFREDLYFRLNVVPIEVPPLRERTEDIPILCRHHLERSATEQEMPRRTISAEASAALQRLPLRGNVRELQNLLDRMCILGETPEITVDDVRRALPLPAPPGLAGSVIGPALTAERVQELGGLVAARQLYEAACIEACLDRTGGNVSEAAKWLQIERSNLHKKMQSLGIEARPPRPGAEGSPP